MFFQDSAYGYSDISYAQAMIWSSPLFYLVILLNAGWLICFEIGITLISFERSLYNNIRLINKELKKPNSTLDEINIGQALLKER